MQCALDRIYDGFAETYEANRGLFDMSEVFASFWESLAEKEHGSLLDLGCGAGEPFGRWFADRGWTVTGVDFSQRMLELAAKYVPEMQTVHADIRGADFPENSFDAVTAIYSLFHVPSGDQPALFAKIRRWLRPQGKMLFTYATKDYTGSEEFDGYKDFMGQQLYYSHRTPAALRSMLAQAGFNIEAAEYRSIGGEIFLWVRTGQAADVGC